jgi:phosphopantothenoylcysteine decarboxylase/phosphopantothenate--cysteine ligase
MAAAVADYRPAAARRGKIQRGRGPMTLELVPNPDIVAAIARGRTPGQVVVGFALETGPGIERARQKLRAKGLDLVVLNSPRAGLGGETNKVTLVEEGSTRALSTLPKREVAEAILDRALEVMKRGRRSAGRRTRPTRRAAASPAGTGLRNRKPARPAGRGRGARA